MNETSWDVAFRDSTRFWVQYFCVPFVVLVGVLGNTVTIYILTRQQVKISANVYLTALAVSDMVFLIFSFSLSLKHYDNMKSMRVYWECMPFLLWITDAASSTSIWLTVSFTIERYLAVCHPMVGKTSITVKRAVIIAAIVYALCFLLTASTPLEWKSVETGSTVFNETGENDTTIFVLENTELGKNVWYRLSYHWFTTIFFVLVPFFILAIGNIFLINAVRMSRQVREHLDGSHLYYQRHTQMMRQEDRMTVILIVVIMVFLICQMPTALILIYTSMYTPPESGSAEENILLGLGNICNLLVAINAACNFILFTALSDKYRRTFCKLFCCSYLEQRCHGRRRRRVHHTMYNLPRLIPVSNLRSAQSEDQITIQRDSTAIDEMINPRRPTGAYIVNRNFPFEKKRHVTSIRYKWDSSQKWTLNTRDYATM